MDINKLRDIFIEEANEIIEKMDVDIINFEEDPTNKELLNELFRGVHTLKGSANSFGFSRLGDFVHHFEDVLDHYRNSEEIVTSDNIDTFLQAVDIIKEVMFVEVDGIDELPKNYDDCLEKIKKTLNSDTPVHVEEKDLGEEFDNEINIPNKQADIDKLTNELIDNEKLYKITLNIDDDMYLRGIDFIKFFKLLSNEGHIIESYWNTKNIPNLEDYDPEKSYFDTVEIYLASKNKKKQISEIFEYLDDYEYKIEKVDVIKETKPTPIKKEDIKFGRRKDDRVETSSLPKNRRKTDSHSVVKIDTNKLDELFDSIGELVIAQNFLAENKEIKNIKNENVTKTINILSKTTRLIQNRVMSLRMVPVQDTFEKMKRVARDASKKVGKEISLIIEGAETEIDKTMIDALSDPLIHLIRNAIDHGIENDVQDRTKLRKESIGTVTLSAFHRAGNIAIEIKDDGKGIDKDVILNKALEKGLLSQDEELTESQIYNLLLQAGFSTAKEISDISGRGVGLDVVKTSIEKLNGKIEITSKIGEGSTFTILLPLTLAIIDGMLVKSEKDTYIIPTLSVIESFIPHKDNVHSFKQKGEFIDLRGEMIPIVRLNELLETGTNKPNVWESTLVCIESEEGKYALLIDDLIGRQQVVIKPLGAALAKIKEVSGSAIMGNGDIALILNTEALFVPQVKIP